jgi:hypothetical protein
VRLAGVCDDPGVTDFAAVDLGAESGRVVRGRFDGERVTLDVAHRFDNRPVRLPDGLRWNPLGLLREIVSGLRGLDGTIRLLRNVMGLWLVQECAARWNATYERFLAVTTTAGATPVRRS